MINLLQPLTPELGSFAKGELSKRPNLWNAKGLWKPSLGITGMTLRDVSGYNIHGTLTNMDMADWVIQNNGYALDFNGSNGYVNLNDNGFYNMTTSFSVSAWGLYRSIPISYGTICGSGNSNGFKFMIDNSATWVLLFGGVALVSGSVTTTTNVLYHMAVTYDGSDVRFYKNGILEDTTSSAAPNAATGDMYIGAGNDSDAGSAPRWYWDGQLGDVRIHSQVLSGSEIQDMYQYPRAMFEFADRTFWESPAAGGGRIMGSLAGHGGLAGIGGIIGQKGGLAG